MPTLEDQVAWEHSSVERGVARYRASLTKMDAKGETRDRSFSDLEPGQRIASEIMVPLVAAIKAAQKQAIDDLAEPGGHRMAGWQWPILCLPADTLASIVLLAALESVRDKPLTPLTRRIGHDVRTEREYVLWGENERKALKDGEIPYSLFRLMHDRNPVVDERVYKKWRKKAKTFEKLEWPDDAVHGIGAFLLLLLVENSGGWLVSQDKWLNGRSTRYLCLSEMAQQWIAHRHNRNSFMRPMLLPMIYPPADYCYTEDAA